MAMTCRAFQTEDEARAEVDRLLAGGTSPGEVRVLMGEPVHDHRDDPTGSFAGNGDTVGAFAGRSLSARDAIGGFSGDASAQRAGGFGDLDRETVATYHDGVKRVRIASHRDLQRMLVAAGLDPETAAADVAALHHGRVLVLAR